MSFPDLQVRNPNSRVHSFTILRNVPFDSSVGRAWDCKGNTVRSQGHWFDPSLKDFLLVAAIFRGYDATLREFLRTDGADAPHGSPTLSFQFDPRHPPRCHSE